MYQEEYILQVGTAALTNGIKKLDPDDGKPGYGATTDQTVINGNYPVTDKEGYGYNQGPPRPGPPPRPASNISRPGMVQPPNSATADPRYGYGDAKPENYDYNNIPLNNLNKGGSVDGERGYDRNQRVDASAVHEDMYSGGGGGGGGGGPQYATRPEYIQQQPYDDLRSRSNPNNPFNRNRDPM